jgi:hypothetical protein
MEKLQACRTPLRVANKPTGAVSEQNRQDARIKNWLVNAFSTSSGKHNQGFLIQRSKYWLNVKLNLKE